MSKGGQIILGPMLGSQSQKKKTEEKLKGENHVGYKEEVFYRDGGEALAQVAQRCGGCPVPGDTQGQSGRALSTDGAVGVPAHCRGVGRDDL